MTSTSSNTPTVYTEHDKFAPKLFGLTTIRPLAEDDWRFRKMKVKYRLRSRVQGGKTSAGEFAVGPEMRSCMVQLWNCAVDASTQWSMDVEEGEDRDQDRVDAIFASCEGYIQNVLRNLADEVELGANAGDGGCPEAPRSLAEPVVLLGHGYGVDGWEEDHLLRDIRVRAEEAWIKANRKKKAVPDNLPTPMPFTSETYGSYIIAFLSEG